MNKGFVIERPDGQRYVKMDPTFGTAWTSDPDEATIFESMEAAERVRASLADYVRYGGVTAFYCQHCREATVRSVS